MRPLSALLDEKGSGKTKLPTFLWVLQMLFPVSGARQLMPFGVEQSGALAKGTSQHPITKPFFQEEGVGQKDGCHGFGHSEASGGRAVKQGSSACVSALHIPGYLWGLSSHSE
jgi:hypothetical protein